MRGLGLTIACLTLVAGAAQAAVTIGATGETGAELYRNATVKGLTTYENGETDAIWASGGKGGSFESIIEVTQSHVSFESGVAVSGGYSGGTAFNSVDITVANTGTQAVSISNFGSTIIPAGLGFYIQDRTGSAQDNNIFTGYGEVGQTYDDNGDPLPVPTFKNFATTVGVGAANPFAFADFDFNIHEAGSEGSLYHLSGSLSLYFDSEGNVQQGYNLSDASLKLLGFQDVEGQFGLDSVYAYKWDATDIVVPLNAILNPGQSTVITYDTRVSAFTRTDCLDKTTCVVGYSGFGDPVGRGGAQDFARSFAVSHVGIDNHCGNDTYGAITHIEFCPVEFDPFRLTNVTTVPEPGTWAMTIVGFGALGSAMRRRRMVLARA